MQNLRVKIAIIFIIILTGFTNYKFTKDVIKSVFPIGDDSITVSMAKYQELKLEIANQKKVGFISYKDNDVLFQDRKLAREFIITQYVLAPVFVDNDINHPFVVGDFPFGPPDPKIVKKNNLKIIRNYGNGIFLLKNTSYHPQKQDRTKNSDYIL